MTHHHSHDHGHTHEHCHEAGHSAESSEEMSFARKMALLLDHWLKHNIDHAANYETWAQKALENQLPGPAAKIREIGALTERINTCLKEARALIPQ